VKAKEEHKCKKFLEMLKKVPHQYSLFGGHH